MNTWHVGLIYSTIFLAGFTIIEFLARKMNVNREISRRIAHVLSSLFGLVMGNILEETVFISMCFFFIIVITISFNTKFFSFIHNVKRKTYGELLLPVGILLSYLVAHDAMVIFSTSVLILAIADPIAGMMGDVFHNKFALRSMIFFIVSLIISLIMLPPGQYVIVVLIASLTTMVERISPYGTDNITIPLTCSILLKLLFQS